MKVLYSCFVEGGEVGVGRGGWDIISAGGEGGSDRPSHSEVSSSSEIEGSRVLSWGRSGVWWVLGRGSKLDSKWDLKSVWRSLSWVLSRSRSAEVTNSSSEVLLFLLPDGGAISIAKNGVHVKKKSKYICPRHAESRDDLIFKSIYTCEVLN